MRTEFDFIQNIKNKYGLSRIGDDCAVLPKDANTDMVVTTDLLVEDIDFRLDWTTPELLGHKALAVSLSDVAAMGAKPVWAMLSVGVSDRAWNSGFVDKLYEGWHALARKHDVELVGGDISRTPDRTVIDSIVGGETAKRKAVLRSGGKVGDAIMVTGALGGSAGGLQLLSDGERLNGAQEQWKKDLLLKHVQPWPKVDIGLYLQDTEIATSMIDISDGLSSDIHHLCRMGSVGALIFRERLPINHNLWNLFAKQEPETCQTNELELALNGGEDFELLFTASPAKLVELDGERFTNIGVVTANEGMIELVTEGQRVILEPKGYRHF